MNKVFLVSLSVVLVTVVGIVADRSTVTPIRAAPIAYAWPGREPLNLPDSEIVECDDLRAVNRCNDGTCTTSSGSGACSSHGGVEGPVIREPASAPVPTQPPAVVPPSNPVPTSTPTLQVLNLPAPTTTPFPTTIGRPDATLAPVLPAPELPAATPAPTIPAQPVPPQNIPASGGILVNRSLGKVFLPGGVLLILMVMGITQAVRKK